MIYSAEGTIYTACDLLKTSPRHQRSPALRPPPHVRFTPWDEKFLDPIDDFNNAPGTACQDGLGLFERALALYNPK